MKVIEVKPMRSPSELEDALRDAGLEQWASRLVRSARRCVIFVPGPIENGMNAAMGASRLGGEPDLPPELDWPQRPPFSPKRQAGPMPAGLLLGRYQWLHRLFRTRSWTRSVEIWERARRAEHDIRSRSWPLSFVAQIDFAEVHAVCALEDFPPAGRLLFFCDPFDLPWGHVEDQMRVRTLFTERPAQDLVRRPAPSEFARPEAAELMPRGYVFKPRVLRPTSWLLPPPPGSREMQHLKAEAPAAWAAGRPAFEAYQRFWDDLYAKHPETFGEQGSMIHQVGGTAFSIQKPVESECGRFADESADPADCWQLVLQIDSDIPVGMEWGDVGRLYVCARKRDLIARNFDRCWTLMQCY